MAADPHWRNTANDVRFLGLDARAFSPFPALLIVKSASLFYFGCVFIVFFLFVEKKLGLNFNKFKRKLRVWITGPVKTVRRMR